MKYRKKPVVIEAVRWTGDNIEEIDAFVVDGGLIMDGDDIRIETLEGDMMADVGDFIIKGIQGEFYPCKPDIFHESYEAIEG